MNTIHNEMIKDLKQCNTIECFNEWLTEVMEYGIDKYGSENKFRLSDEYRNLYNTFIPFYNDLKDKKIIELKELSDILFDELGLQYGDRVEYTPNYITQNILWGDMPSGVLVERKGLPYVRLDKKYNGKRYIKWNKSWIKE